MADELTPKLDADGNEMKDAEGNTIMEEIESGTPKLDAEGKPVLDADGNPVMEVAPAEPIDNMEWLDTTKYGSDVSVATTKQAKAYHGAEKRMNQAIESENLSKRENTLIKQELEVLKAGKVTQPSIDPTNIPDEVRLGIQREFGEDADPADIIRQTKITTAIVQPLLVAQQKSEWRAVKAELQKDDILFSQFPELLERVETLPLAERVDEDKINQIRAKYLNEKLPEIVEKARLEGAKSVTVKPKATQTTETSTQTPAKKEVKKIELSAEHKKYISEHGGDPAETESYLNRTPGERKGFLQHAE